MLVLWSDYDFFDLSFVQYFGDFWVACILKFCVLCFGMQFSSASLEVASRFQGRGMLWLSRTQVRSKHNTALTGGLYLVWDRGTRLYTGGADSTGAVSTWTRHDNWREASIRFSSGLRHSVRCQPSPSEDRVLCLKFSSFYLLFGRGECQPPFGSGPSCCSTRLSSAVSTRHCSGRVISVYILVNSVNTVH